MRLETKELEKKTKHEKLANKKNYMAQLAGGNSQFA